MFWKRLKKQLQGEITTNAAACMVFMSILGNGQGDEKIKEEIIGSLGRDPDATNLDDLREIINDIEAGTLIKSGVNASKIWRMNRGENSKGVEKSKQQCQVCSKSFHLAEVFLHRCRKEECNKTPWHNKNKCPKGKVKHQATTPGKKL